MRLKICGITQPDQGVAIARLGATALGFICVPSSPRYVTPDQIHSITQRLNGQKTGLAGLETAPKPVDRVGVFANATLETIGETVRIGGLNGVQLHGDESRQFCQQVKAAWPKVNVMKAFRIRDRAALAQPHHYASVVDTLLLDAYHPTMLGGTGHTLDWSLLQSFQPDCPWFLAGGLNPDNVQDAIAQVRPDGIDVSSGVEDAPGHKNLDQVALLCKRLQGES